jgi:hypothetical protein
VDWFKACHLGVNLALELLVNPPNLMMEVPAAVCKGKRKKINPASHQLSCLASATLSKCAFLCNVLSESVEHHHLAFKVGMFALEMARPPASTKPLEVSALLPVLGYVFLLNCAVCGRLNWLIKKQTSFSF